MYSPLTVLWHWAERKLKWYPVLSGNCSHHEQSKSYSYNKTLSCFIQIFLSFWCVWAFCSTKLVLEKTVSAWQGRVCLCEAAVCICVYVVTVCLKLCLPGKKKKKAENNFLKSSRSIVERELKCCSESQLWHLIVALWLFFRFLGPLRYRSQTEMQSWIWQCLACLLFSPLQSQTKERKTYVVPSFYHSIKKKKCFFGVIVLGE